jgi:hypothetical protein
LETAQEQEQKKAARRLLLYPKQSINHVKKTP